MDTKTSFSRRRQTGICGRRITDLYIQRSDIGRAWVPFFNVPAKMGADECIKATWNGPSWDYRRLNLLVKRCPGSGLSVSFGWGRGETVELVSAYSVFANGKRVEPVAILKVADEQGRY